MSSLLSWGFTPTVLIVILLLSLAASVWLLLLSWSAHHQARIPGPNSFWASGKSCLDIPVRETNLRCSQATDIEAFTCINSAGLGFPLRGSVRVSTRRQTLHCHFRSSDRVGYPSEQGFMDFLKARVIHHIRSIMGRHGYHQHHGQ